LAALEDAHEAVEELPSEHLGQSANGEQKTLGTRCEEVLLLEGEGAAGDDAIQMGMKREVLRNLSTPMRHSLV
jgi:hypothetical protein